MKFRRARTRQPISRRTACVGHTHLRCDHRNRWLRSPSARSYTHRNCRLRSPGRRRARARWPEAGRRGTSGRRSAPARAPTQRRRARQVRPLRHQAAPRPTLPRGTLEPHHDDRPRPKPPPAPRARRRSGGRWRTRASASTGPPRRTGSRSASSPRRCASSPCRDQHRAHRHAARGSRDRSRRQRGGPRAQDVRRARHRGEAGRPARAPRHPRRRRSPRAEAPRQRRPRPAPNAETAKRECERYQKLLAARRDLARRARPHARLSAATRPLLHRGRATRGANAAVARASETARSARPSSGVVTERYVDDRRVRARQTSQGGRRSSRIDAPPPRFTVPGGRTSRHVEGRAARSRSPCPRTRNREFAGTVRFISAASARPRATSSPRPWCEDPDRRAAAVGMFAHHRAHDRPRSPRPVVPKSAIVPREGPVARVRHRRTSGIEERVVQTRRDEGRRGGRHSAASSARRSRIVIEARPTRCKTAKPLR